jgi:hypothetical protein
MRRKYPFLTCAVRIAGALDEEVKNSLMKALSNLAHDGSSSRFSDDMAARLKSERPVLRSAADVLSPRSL